MEPAKIDWNTLESFFVIDQVYENINAPQWVDFLAPHRHSPDYDHDDDQAWFCRPDCKHPKTAEDFLKSTPSKLLRSVSVSKLIGDWTRRDANLKRRGAGQTQSNEDTTENQNPNFCTPPNHHKTKSFFKAGIKSSAQKTPQEKEEEDEYSEILLHSEEKQQQKPRLRSTQSARDLFGGKDIFNKITDFCSELKKMATWAKEKEIHDQNPVEVRKKENVLGSVSEKKMEQRDNNNKQRKPFSELRKEGCQAGGEKSSSTTTTKKKIQKKKILDGDDDEAENIPVSLNLNMKEVKRKEEERLLPIRTNPPTPQGFSATRDHPAKATPSKGPKSRLKERDIFQELEQNRTLREELGAKYEASPMAGREARGGALDVFWFLKPCTLST